MSAEENTYNYEGLSQADIKKAQKELGENPQQVRAHIASLRRWLTSMPHLTCRTDDGFLLRFLRTAKFDQSRAQQLLDNFCTVRTSPRGTPEWFVPYELDSPVLNELLRLRFNMNLGFNDNGEAVMMSNMSGFDPDKYEDPLTSLLRVMYMLSDVLFTDERLLIHGVHLVSNMDGMTRKQTKIWENPRVMFKMMRNWQDAFPIRMKGIIYFNEPGYMDVMMRLFLPLMKEKLRKRVYRCGSDVSKLKKAMGPGAEKLLPADLGGKNKSQDELVEDRIAKFKSEEAQEERRKLAMIKVDEEKRQSTTSNYLKAYDGANDPTMGISGTFTKLDVS